MNSNTDKRLKKIIHGIQDIGREIEANYSENTNYFRPRVLSRKVSKNEKAIKLFIQSSNNFQNFVANQLQIISNKQSNRRIIIFSGFGICIGFMCLMHYMFIMGKLHTFYHAMPLI